MDTDSHNAWALRGVRTRFIVWTACMLAVIAAFALQVLPKPRVETDILALLPAAQQDAAMDDALDAFSARLARKQLFLIGAPEAEVAKNSARAFAELLRASKAFARVDLELTADAQQRFGVYLQHRAYLLSKDDVEALRAGKTDALAQQALRSAFTPAGLMQPITLTQDPLGVINRFLQSQRLSLGNAQLDGAVLTVTHDGWTFVLLTVECDGSPFASSVQERVMPAIESAKRAVLADKNVTIYSSGTMQHAAAATERAVAEISTFGSIELLGVIVLLWSVLGALRPLALASMTLAFATLTAFTAVHTLFGTVHILALVFGSSLIGGVIDYSIHFFADRFRDPGKWTPADALRHVGGAILLGLITTLIGYVVLALVPFPGLTQIAVFCAVGLATGCGCVLCWYPVLAQPGKKPLPRFGARVGAAIDNFMTAWRWTRARIALALIGGVVILFGLTRAHIQDDIRALQESPPYLVQQEIRVRELLGSGVETRFFLVSGKSEQAVLETEQRLAAKLDALIAEGAVTSYQAISNNVPPLSQQQVAHALLAERVYAQQGLLDRVMKSLGFPSEAIEKRRNEFLSSSAPLQLDTWLQSPAAEGSKHLWLDKVGDRYATVVTLGGIRDVQAITDVRIEDVRLIDRVASTSDILTQYRRVMSMLLALIYVVAGIVLAIRFGWRDAPRMLLPSALATATTLGLFGWFGVPINLFTLLALWLVLGLGIDYGIFLRHGQAAKDRASRPTAILSVTLSACTTLLAFGLLAFSATPFIRSIGLTLLCAIMLSWIFVLFSCLTTSRHE